MTFSESSQGIYTQHYLKLTSLTLTVIFQMFIAAPVQTLHEILG